MAASLSDQAILSAEATFQSRVRQSLMAACIAIINEAQSVGLHSQRVRQCVAIMNNPEAYKPYYAMAAATDATVISGATTGGTVVLTIGNVTAAQANVTDASIANAISGQFNSFFMPM